MRKWKEWFSILLNKAPGKVVLITILLINAGFILLSAAVISALSLSGTEHMNFWEAAFYTVTMILDAGCIQFVVADIGAAGVALVIVCLVIIIIGMVLFTGAVIGYSTNYISDFIQNANGGNHRLVSSNHTVIINWNSRASEIVNDMLYGGVRHTVVILVPANKDAILKELEERLQNTVDTENKQLADELATLPFAKRHWMYARKKLKNKLVIVVREGDTYSTKQLNDVSVAYARTIIILGNDNNGAVCKYNRQEATESTKKGNAQTIKTLMQVAELTADANSADNQKIVVEVDDDWTMEAVQMIIEHKQVEGKCNIVPVCVNKILGQLLSQFSIMPELNMAYYELLSNKGVTFYARPTPNATDADYMQNFLRNRYHAIPLTAMMYHGKNYGYYAASHEADDRIVTESDVGAPVSIQLNKRFWLEQRNIVILGHNSKLRYLMDGFDSFRAEWNFVDGGEILNVLVIDDKAHLERMNYYRDYPYVAKVVEADIYDKDLICNTIESFVDANEQDTSVLVLSDDAVPSDEIDAHAITNLIYIREIIRNRKLRDPDFDEGRIDVVVEIINPKHFDVIKNYNIKNIVISNRYISKMIGQLGEKDIMFDFYRDILSYDDTNDSFESKELYIKKVQRFFDVIPPACTAAELIRSLYQASSDPTLPDAICTHSILLGYVKQSGEVVLFTGDQNKIRVHLQSGDKLILFADH